MKNYILLYVYTITSLFALCIDKKILNAQRIIYNNKINDAYATGLWNEFQFTLIPNRNTFIQNSPPIAYGFLTLMPYVGHYGTPYRMRNRLALIQANSKQANNALPNNLKQALSSMELSINAKIEYVIVMYGIYADDPIFDIENIVVHPWANTWKKSDYFSTSIFIGVFDPDSIKPMDIGLNIFKSLPISVHNVKGKNRELAFSPNNAKFSIHPKTRAFASSWFAAISATKEHVIIAFMIFANTQEAQNILSQNMEFAETLDDLIKKLAVSAAWFTQEDQNVLLNAVTTIKNITLGKRITDSSFPDYSTEELINRLTSFFKTLKNLEKKL